MTTRSTKLGKCFAVVAILFACAALTFGCASRQPAPTDTGQLDTESGAKRITEIVATEDAQSYIVIIKGDRQLTYTSVKQNLPLGVLFYFPETNPAESVRRSMQPDNAVVSAIDVSQLSEQQNLTRVLISLKKDIPYNVTPEGTGIRVAFNKSRTEAPTPATAAVGGRAPVAAAAETGKPAESLKGVFAVKSATGTTINVTADGTVSDFKAFTLDAPARIVVDLPGLKSPFKGSQSLPVNTKWVSRVRHFGYPDKVRVVVDTHKDYLKTFSAVPAADGLRIEVADTKPAAAAVSPEPSPAAPTVAATGVPPLPAAEAAPVKSAAAAADAGKPAWINRIDFRSEEDGRSTLIVGTTRPVDYELTAPSAQLLKLKLENTRLPQYRDRPLITTRFESAVNRITPVYKPSLGDVSFITIELREAVPHHVEQQDDLLLVRFEPSSVPPKPLEQADLPSWKKVMAQADIGSEPAAAPAPVMETAPAAAAETAAAPPAPPAPAPSATPAAAAPPAIAPATGPAVAPKMAPLVLAEEAEDVFASSASSFGKQRRYSGEKIALDFYETDIKNVFRILREISGKNFAIDKDVTGTVTLTLETPVPWDQVLDLVLKMNRLGMAFEGDIIRIATLSTLTAEERARQEQIAAAQKSKQVVEALEPLVTEYIPVNYSDAKGEILPHVQGVLTKDRGNISVDQRNNQLIVTDTAAKIEQIKEIVARIDTVTPQVIIEAKVVEVTEEFSMELGIDWTLVWGPINQAFGTAGNLTNNVSMNFPSEASSTVGFSFEKLTGTPFVLDATLNAVEANKQGRIITAPKIVTLDNKKAKIKQGVEWPYLERDSSGNATVKFKNIDLLLEVTPTVTPDDRILMKIFITKNDIGTITLGVPSLNTNEAQTELLVNDGDTIVIGGIIKKNEQDSVNGWPGLKDVPILGWLFKSASESDTSNELLIFITPRIVQLEQRRVL
jgi:type IV pilus assembly protein PilQ